MVEGSLRSKGRPLLWKLVGVKSWIDCTGDEWEMRMIEWIGILLFCSHFR
jgi:hypothetical protein